MKSKEILLSFCCSIILFSTSCDTGNNSTTGETQNANEVVIHEMDDPDGLNPITSTAANALYMQNNIFSKLLVYDMETAKLTPQLAVALPQVNKIEEGYYKGGMSLVFEIHPEASWDNGSPVTAADYLFTIKTIKNPKVNSAQFRPYFDFLDSIEIDPTNNKKFTIYSKERYFRAEESAGQEPFILPEYAYDPELIMRQFSMSDLNNPEKVNELMNDPAIIRFADAFNGPDFDKNKDNIVGCGPYKLDDWASKQRIVLSKKEDWWGDKVSGNKYLEANPSKIIYKTLPNMTNAIKDAKEGGIDVIRTIQPSKFMDLQDDALFTKDFELSTPEQFAYHYIGFNSKRPQFRDKRVRRAIAHLIDRNDMIESIFNGYATKTNGPINPNKEYYNNELQDIEYDIEKAKALLTEAGWKDTDGDSYLDKMVDGKKVSMQIEFKYNQGHVVRKSIGQILSDNAKRVGIDVKLTPVDFPTLLDDADQRNFDMVALAWVKTPGLDDMKQVWHTDAAVEGGSNRVSFGNETSDAIIEEIRVTLDEAERNELYKKIQEIIYDEQPCIFLFVPKELIAINKKFSGIGTSAVRPGYRESSFLPNNM